MVKPRAEIQKAYRARKKRLLEEADALEAMGMLAFERSCDTAAIDEAKKRFLLMCFDQPAEAIKRLRKMA